MNDSPRRLIVCVPGLAAEPGLDSCLRSAPESLVQMASEGEVCGLSAMSGRGTPEAAWLGVDPESIDLAAGPLMVAALGHDPPERSVHFHLTLMSVDEEGLLRRLETDPLEDHVDQALAAAAALQTPRLTVLPGEALDHALVWEGGSLEMSTTEPQEAAGKPPLASAPEGDGERVLRRFIDDSINLLSELEVNKMREDAGLPPLTVLWPWGQGARTGVPNLALRRGEPAYVESGQLRMAGLARLTGYRHGDRKAFGRKLRTNWGHVRAAVAARDPLILVFHSVAEMRRHERLDEIERFLAEFCEAVVEPSLAAPVERPVRITLLATPLGPYEGLALTWESWSRRSGLLPFDERVLESRGGRGIPPWEAVAAGL